MHGNFVAADEVVGQSHVVEVVDFDHQMINAQLVSRDPEGHGMIAIITMHEDGSNQTFANADFIFDAAAHAQKAIEAIGGIHIFLTDNTVAQPTRSGLEATMHPAPWMEWFARLYFWPMED